MGQTGVLKKKNSYGSRNTSRLAVYNWGRKKRENYMELAKLNSITKY